MEQPFKWKKLGLVYQAPFDGSWRHSHALTPTPYLLDERTLRVIITCRDPQGRGRPGWVDLDAQDPTRVLGVSTEPLLDLGRPGCFDDSGVAVTGVVSPEPGLVYLYYAGFELCTQVRYRIFTGMAISRDGGRTFRRASEAPVLDRSDEGLALRSGPCALLDGGKFKIWYLCGSEWIEQDGKQVPLYDLRYQESADGMHWSDRGVLSLPVDPATEHGFGHPWVVKRGPGDYQLFCSVRRKGQGYRPGYAESADGVNWASKDRKMGLEVSKSGFDSKAIAYVTVFSSGGRTWCAYCGDNFGEAGFALARLEAR